MRSVAFVQIMTTTDLIGFTSADVMFLGPLPDHLPQVYQTSAISDYVSGEIPFYVDEVISIFVPEAISDYVFRILSYFFGVSGKFVEVWGSSTESVECKIGGDRLTILFDRKILFNRKIGGIKATVDYRGETFVVEFGRDYIVSIVAEPGELLFCVVDPLYVGKWSLPDANGKSTGKAVCSARPDL